MNIDDYLRVLEEEIPHTMKAHKSFAEVKQYIENLRGGEAYMAGYRSGWNDALDEVRNYLDLRKRA